MTNPYLKICSWNVRGLCHPVKRRKVIDHMAKKQCDILLLQETHLSVTEAAWLKRDWVGSVHASPSKGRSAGVAILLHKRLETQGLKFSHDPDGRWAELSFKIKGSDIAILNIYAPNTPSQEFWSEISTKVNLVESNHFVIGGDFNSPIDPILDRSSTCRFSKVPAHNTMCSLLLDGTICDPWRVLNPQERDYTYYSAMHASYSRLDHLLVSPSLMSSVTDAKIHPIVISDHAPISLTLDITISSSHPPMWRLNDLLLEDERTRKKIAQRTDSFFRENKVGDTAFCTIWDAYKATLRGELISASSHLNKVKRDKENQLEKEIGRLEWRHRRAPNNQVILQELIRRKLEFNKLLSARVRTAHLRESAILFADKNKAGRVMARYLKKRAQRARVVKLGEGNGKFKTKDEDIVSTFADYYKNLYTSEFNP